MQRISLTWIVENTSPIERLMELRTDSSVSNARYLMFSAKSALNSIVNNSVYSPFIKISRQSGANLEAAIDELFKNTMKDEAYQFQDFEIWTVTDAATRFRTILLSELATFPTFLVSTKGGYDVDKLIENGASLFPHDTWAKVPEAFKDAQEAGRCLAFEMFTACGFHTFRVVEAVVRRYWDAVAGVRPRPVPETIGKIAGQMAQSELGEEKVWETLKQIAKLHRNPIAHPEVLLDGNEAISMIGIAQSAIAAMLPRIQTLELTTTNGTPIQR
jgi:hypothetical protein